MNCGLWRRMRIRRYPSVRTILLIVNLTVLLLPMGGFLFFRIYENRLVHESETELIAQSAVMAALMKKAILSTVAHPETFGARLAPPPPPSPHGKFTPVFPQIDLASSPLLPPRPDGEKTAGAAAPQMLEIGWALTEIFIEAQKTTLAGMRLLDWRGVVIGGREDIGLSLAHVEEVQRAMKGSYASALRRRISDEAPPPLASISRGTGIRIFSVYPVVYKDRLWGLVYLSRAPSNILRDLYAEHDRVLLLAATLLSITLIIGLLTSLTISWPIKTLIRRAERMAEGDEAAMTPLPHPGSHEIAQLSRSFSDMARAVHQRSQYIRNFAAHVSHEFKTPLTSIQGSAELLGEHMNAMSEEERARFLNGIIENTDRLKRLVSRLLELARADNITPTGAVIDLQSVLEQFRAAARDGPDIAISGADGLRARISEENFLIIAGNLVANAGQHNARSMQIQCSQKAGEIEIAFTDDGDGVSPRNREKIFQPFFTTKREHGGTGLGLRIVVSLLQAHHGSIRLARCGKGASFVVTLSQG
jgi:signal transduction histidine kinase